MKRHIGKILAVIIYYILDLCADISIKIGIFLSRTYVKIWGLLGTPWFDHRFDYLGGPENWVWSERGIYGSKLIRSGDKILDICCGDGIYSGLFYSKFACKVHAIDRDEKSIKFSNKKYAGQNVTFSVCDITRDDFPSNNYDVIVMFAAIEHFSVEQGTSILKKIATALSKSSNGCFLGSTPIFKDASGHGHPEHDNEFTSLNQLHDFLSPHFAEIEVWSSKWSLTGERKDTYFLCRKPIISPEQ